MIGDLGVFVPVEFDQVPTPLINEEPALVGAWLVLKLLNLLGVTKLPQLPDGAGQGPT